MHVSYPTPWRYDQKVLEFPTVLTKFPDHSSPQEKAFIIFEIQQCVGTLKVFRQKTQWFQKAKYVLDLVYYKLQTSTTRYTFYTLLRKL
jgi:hypothetical protein